jgi:pimeloyl-ACP methyl ester carboxylesterase
MDRGHARPVSHSSTALRISRRMDEPDATVGGFRGGSGTPLVLLHPAMTSWRVWRPLLPSLVERHDVLALTLTGHRGGPCRDAGRPLTFAMLADHVERSLEGVSDVLCKGGGLIVEP